MTKLHPQIEIARRLTATLAAELNNTNNFLDVYHAVIRFTDSMDTEAHVLGDGDLAGIAGRACERRGKSAEVLPVLAKVDKFATAFLKANGLAKANKVAA